MRIHIVGFLLLGAAIALASPYAHAITADQEGTCTDPKKDSFYLYQVGKGLTIELLNEGKSFRASYKGRTLRESYPNERFFKDPTKKQLSINYQLTPVCGGVDVVYSIINSTHTPQRLPTFQIDGLHYGPISPKLGVLGLDDLGNIVPLDANTTQADINSITRGNYAPVVAMHNDIDAIGSSLQYPYLSYKHSFQQNLKLVTEGLQQGTWQHLYNEFHNEGYPEKQQPYATIPAQASRIYTVSLRFAAKRHWLLTLEAYKRSFKYEFGKGSAIEHRDPRPVLNGHIDEIDHYNEITNPRSYLLKTKIHTEGWGPWVTKTIATALGSGFERILIWNPAGIYKNKNFNMPPQFQNFAPLQEATLGELSNFAKNGISLGFSWGRSAQVPFPLNIDWDPEGLNPARYDNHSHKLFLATQLGLAVALGTREIRLDHFVDMLASERYLWIMDMKKAAPGVRFAQEGSGPAFIHSRISQWYYPEKHLPLTGPDVLSRYLNGDAAIYAYYPGGIDQAFCKTLVSWGYTPSLNGPGVDPEFDALTCAKTPLTKCFNQIDDDGDGAIDFPYDSGCQSAQDNIE